MRMAVRGLLLATAVVLGTAASASAASFGNIYYFGDSLTDCCFQGRFTNGGTANWSDLLPPLMGAGYSASLQSNLAAGGAQSGPVNNYPSIDQSYGGPSGFLGQVSRFGGEGITVNLNDIAAIWIGTNDILISAQPAGTSPGASLPLGVQPSVSALANYVAGNVRKGIQTLVNDGFRNIILVSPFDVGQANVEPDAASRALATQYSIAVRDQLAGLTTPGVNTYFFDTLSLLQRVQANPAAFGFAHTTGHDSCQRSNCASLSSAQQNTFVFNDDIHVTNGFDQLLANSLSGVVDRFRINEDGTDPAAIPEPASAALALVGLAGLGITRGRRKKAA
jgi:phospholipase/lecithinase/hemolysin